MSFEQFNKLAGWFLFALIVFFGIKTLTDILMPVQELKEPAYRIAGAEDAAPSPPTEAKAPDGEAKPQIPLGQLLAKADVAAGEKAAKKCLACHSFEKGGANKIGPALWGILGRQIASHSGFSYSDALSAKQGTWGWPELSAFLEDPKAFAAGTKMAFAGIKNGAERADLLLYLRSLSDRPEPLPQP
jgi:cytochrome c